MIYVPAFLVLIPVVTGILILMFRNERMYLLAFLAQTLITVLAVSYFFVFRDDFASGAFVLGGWPEHIGITLANDRLSMSFIFLTILLWWVVLFYKYEPRKTDHSFLFFFLFLQGVFFGLLQTNDLFNLFVFIELTTIVATVLVGFKKTGSSLRAAIYYLLINTSGILMFLIGVLLLYNVFGTINLLHIRDNMEAMDSERLVQLAYILMMAGISIKAAIFPVYTWLPKAHGAAQSAVSALLSGLIVKSGVYLFIRMNQMFAALSLDYVDFFFIIGALTAIVGVVFALSQKDIKQILAYHTVSQVGIVFMGLAQVDAMTAHGGLLHAFHHGMFKSLLFLCAGVIIKVYRTKNVSEIRGVMKTMPFVSAMMIIGMLSITGAPLFNGYISKSIIKYGIEANPFQYAALFAVNIGTAASFIKASQIFFGEKPLSYAVKKRPPYVALAILSILCLVFGVFFAPLSDFFFTVDISHVSILSARGILEYALYLIAGYLIFRLIIKKDGSLIQRLRGFRPSFETANYVFVLYMAAMALHFIVL